MEPFTIEQLGLFITLMATACGGLLAILIKSRCDKIDCLCLKIHRKPLPPPGGVSPDEVPELPVDP